MMSKIVKVTLCLGAFLVVNGHASEMTEGLLNQVSNLLLRGSQRDIEANLPGEIVQNERLINALSAVIAPGLNIIINGRKYVDLILFNQVLEGIKSQETYADSIIFTFKKCGEGDSKAISKVMGTLLAVHGFVRIFI